MKKGMCKVREKIRTTDIEGGILKFGKKYGIDVYGASFWFEFTFSRKKRQYVTCTGSSGRSDTVKMSKRKLKQFINDKSITRFVFEFND
jgi:hypothetical protein